MLTLYLWLWSSGQHDFAAWSARDQLDTDGYIDCYIHPQIQTLRLDMQAHQPVVERRTFHATDELPSELRERVRIEIPGIWYNHTLEQYQSYPDVTLLQEIGIVPCAWVRARIAATTEATP